MAKKSLKELKDERALKFAEVDLASKAGEAESRNMNTEEFTAYETKADELRALDTLIAQEVKLEHHAQLRAVTIGSGHSEGNRDTSVGDERDLGSFNLNRALLAKLDNRALDGVEAEVHQMGEARAKEDGIKLSGNSVVVLDHVLQKRGQTVTGQTTNVGDQGGVLVPKDVQGVLEVLQANTFLDEVGARFMTGLSGDIAFPVQDSVPVIQDLTEIEAMTDSEILWSEITMKPARRGTTVPISRQLLIQSSIDMQRFVIDSIGMAFAQKMNAEAISTLLSIIISGNGNLLALGTDGAAPTYNNVVALAALVEGYNHKRGKPVYLTNTKVEAKLKTTQIFSGTSGEPVWSKEDVLNGHTAVTSNIVPSNITKGASGATLSALVYGNFYDFLVGMWGATEYIIDPFTQKKKAQIEVTANAFYSMKAARVKSFAGIKDAITTLA